MCYLNCSEECIAKGNNNNKLKHFNKYVSSDGDENRYGMVAWGNDVVNALSLATKNYEMDRCKQ